MRNNKYFQLISKGREGEGEGKGLQSSGASTGSAADKRLIVKQRKEAEGGGERSVCGRAAQCGVCVIFTLNIGIGCQLAIERMLLLLLYLDPFFLPLCRGGATEWEGREGREAVAKRSAVFER